VTLNNPLVYKVVLEDGHEDTILDIMLDRDDAALSAAARVMAMQTSGKLPNGDLITKIVRQKNRAWRIHRDGGRIAFVRVMVREDVG
jgi:hypothetical protein